MKTFNELRLITEESPKMTPEQEAKREEIVLTLKKKKEEFVKRYGARWEEVMYATATKLAMEEQVIAEEEEWGLIFQFDEPDYISKEGREIQRDLERKFKKVYSGSGSGGGGWDVSFNGSKKELEKAKKYVESKYKKFIDPKYTVLAMDESVQLDEDEKTQRFFKEVHAELKKVMDDKYYREFRASNDGRALDNVINHFGKSRGYRVDKTVKSIIDKYGRNRDEYIKKSFEMAANTKRGFREEVELDEASQRFGGDTNIPASPELKKHIESGKAKILINVPSALHPSARFLVIKNPKLGDDFGNTRANQDKVAMTITSDPKRGRIKMFSFHGTHVSHQRAMDFAKKHKLVAMKDEKGNPLYAKESVELDERYDKPVKFVYRAKNVKAMRELSDIAADEMPNKVKQGFFSVEGNPKSKTLAVTFNSEYDREQFEDEYKEELKRLTVRESVELDEGKTEFAVVAKASGMLIKAFPKEEHARMYIKNQYSQRKNLKGNLGIIEVPKSRAPGNNMKKHGEIEVVKEFVEINEGSAWDAILRIKDQKQAEKVHGLLVDMQTAKLLCDVMYALNKGNQKKFMAAIDKNAMGLKKMVDFAWKQVK